MIQDSPEYRIDKGPFILNQEQLMEQMRGFQTSSKMVEIDEFALAQLSLGSMAMCSHG